MAEPSVKWSQPLARVGAGLASVVLIALMITTEWDTARQMPTTGATVSARQMSTAAVSRKLKDEAAVASPIAAGRMVQETVAYTAERVEARKIRRQIRQLTNDVGSGSGSGDLCSCDSGSGSGALVGDSGSGSGSGDSGSGSGDMCPCDSGSGSGVLVGVLESASGSGDVGSGPCAGSSCAEPEPPLPPPPPPPPPPPSSPPPSPPPPSSPPPSPPPQYVEQRSVPTPTADTQSTILAENNGCTGLLCDTGPSTARIKRIVLEEDGPAYYLAHFSVVFDQELFVYGSKYDNDTLKSVSELPLQSTNRRDGRHTGETPPFLQPINLAMGGAYELNCQNSAADGFPVMSGNEEEEESEEGAGATYLKRMTTMPPLKIYTVPDCNIEEGCMILLSNGEEEHVSALSYASEGACYGLADFSVCPAQADILPHGYGFATDGHGYGYEGATFQPPRTSFCLGADCVEADLDSGARHLLTLTLTLALALTLP